MTELKGWRANYPTNEAALLDLQQIAKARFGSISAELRQTPQEVMAALSLKNVSEYWDWKKRTGHAQAQVQEQLSHIKCRLREIEAGCEVVRQRTLTAYDPEDPFDLLWVALDIIRELRTEADVEYTDDEKRFMEDAHGFIGTHIPKGAA